MRCPVSGVFDEMFRRLTLVRLFSTLSLSPSLSFLSVSHSLTHFTFAFRWAPSAIHSPGVFRACNTTLNLDLTSHGPSVRPPPRVDLRPIHSIHTILAQNLRDFLFFILLHIQLFCLSTELIVTQN
ncbi:hypothetical protein GGI35DRAFT_237483 [Trichoderma velutinum]